MRAISLWRPWPWCIFACPAGGVGPKRVENRGWAPPQQVIGAEIGVHAAKTYDHEVHAFVRRIGLEMPRAEALAPREPGGVPRPVHPEGVIVGVARVTGWVRADNGRVLGFSGVTSARANLVASSPWFFGPFGWVLDDVVALPRPVAHRGAQGLWVVQPSAARDVADQVREVRGRGRRQQLDRLAEELAP
jgi:hypothetical protein